MEQSKPFTPHGYIRPFLYFFSTLDQPPINLTELQAVYMLLHSIPLNTFPFVSTSTYYNMYDLYHPNTNRKRTGFSFLITCLILDHLSFVLQFDIKAVFICYPYLGPLSCLDSPDAGVKIYQLNLSQLQELISSESTPVKNLFSVISCQGQRPSDQDSNSNR